MARSLRDCDCCNCSRADSGVGGADFRLGAMLSYCCLEKLAKSATGGGLFVLVMGRACPRWLPFTG
jgi:hypothetical protein